MDIWKLLHTIPDFITGGFYSLIADKFRDTPIQTYDLMFNKSADLFFAPVNTVKNVDDSALKFNVMMDQAQKVMAIHEKTAKEAQKFVSKMNDVVPALEGAVTGANILVQRALQATSTTSQTADEAREVIRKIDKIIPSLQIMADNLNSASTQIDKKLVPEAITTLKTIQGQVKKGVFGGIFGSK